MNLRYTMLQRVVRVTIGWHWCPSASVSGKLLGISMRKDAVGPHTNRLQGLLDRQYISTSYSYGCGRYCLVALLVLIFLRTTGSRYDAHS